MLRCTRCEGFVPAASPTCPNCSKLAPRGRTGTGFLAVVGAGVAALTLMACYGSPPCTPHQTADGGTTSCSGEQEPLDAGTGDAGSTDAGSGDGGTTCDAGTADGGC